MKKIKILIVDDTDFLREAIKKFFEDYNCEVLTSNNGLIGLKYAIEEKPDLIVLDLMMAGFTGIDVLKNIKNLEFTKNIPTIIITSYKDNPIVEEAKALAPEKIIFKPLKRGEIFSAVDELLGENYLVNLRNKKLSNQEDELDADAPLVSNVELKNKLIKLFLKFIDVKKRDLKASLEVRNEMMLKAVLHDLKGNGNTIGYPKLTLLSEFLENKITNAKGRINWQETTIYIEKINELLDIIKKENSSEPS